MKPNTATAEAARARTFQRLPRRGGVTALAQAIRLEILAGHEEQAAALAVHLVRVARISRPRQDA